MFNFVCLPSKVSTCVQSVTSRPVQSRKPPIDKISQVCENRKFYLYAYLGYYDEFLNRGFCICLSMMPILWNYFRKKNGFIGWNGTLRLGICCKCMREDMALRPTHIYIDGDIKLLYIFHFSLFLYYTISFLIIYYLIMK